MVVAARFLVVVGFVSLLLGTVFLVSTTNAAIGNGGEGSGGSEDCDGRGIPGCPWTSNGHGWRAIRVDAGDAPRGNGYWAAANPACKAEGATHVIAYLVFTGEQTQSQAYIYKFPRSWGGFGSYNGTLTVTDAENLYQQVPWSERRYFTFGSDVGWFCYSEYNYDLRPTISVGNAVEAGTTVQPAGSITNSGSTKTPSSIQWQVATFYLDPGVSAIPRSSGGASAQAPSAYYDTGGARGLSVTTHRTGQTFQSSSSGAQSVTIPGQQVGDLAVGSKVCYTLSVQPRRHDNNEWRHSAPSCATIVKKPKVQVHGGDLSVGKAFVGQATPAGSDIVTSRTTRTLGGTARTFGSWVEYGVRANGQISGIGAGSAYSVGLVSATVCGTNLLTFSNTNGVSCSASQRLGYYSSAKSIPSVATAFPVNSSTPEFNSLADANLRRVEKVTGNITLSGATIGRGDWLVINAEGRTVTIDGNIRYTSGGLDTINDIPQLVIIADRINITQGVNRVDAWLIATGTNGVINTCSDVATLTAQVCDDQLVVNGPVMAKSLLLRRTYGADNSVSAARPAEIFNLRPDAYLWSIARAQSANRIQSVYTRELPPRF